MSGRWVATIQQQLPSLYAYLTGWLPGVHVKVLLADRLQKLTPCNQPSLCLHGVLLIMWASRQHMALLTQPERHLRWAPREVFRLPWRCFLGLVAVLCSMCLHSLVGVLDCQPLPACVQVQKAAAGALGCTEPQAACAQVLLLASWGVRRLGQPHAACAQALLLTPWDVRRLCQPLPVRAQVQEAAAGVLGCTEVWKRGNQSVKPAASLLRLIAALDELPVAQMLSKSWEKAEPGEQPACLASWGTCLLLRHPIGILSGCSARQLV